MHKFWEAIDPIRSQILTYMFSMLRCANVGFLKFQMKKKPAAKKVEDIPASTSKAKAKPSTSTSQSKRGRKKWTWFLVIQ